MANFSRKFRCTTDSNHSLPVAANILNRQIDQKAVNKVWLANMTYVPTREVCSYLSVVKNYLIKILIKVYGSNGFEKNYGDALDIPIQRRMPREGITAHSNKGSRYANDQ